MKQKMRAAIFQGEGKLELCMVDIPKLRKPDDVLVQVEACSICGTDVHILNVPPGYHAKPGTILGHELVGKVIATGEAVTQVKTGDRVVCNPNEYCGVCNYCRKNLPNLCEHIIPLGIEEDGGFAEYVRLSECCTYRVADDLPAEIAMFAEPLACMMNGVKKLCVQPGESVLILGAGPIGLMMVQLMKASGASPIIVSETSSIRRKIAMESGADIVVDPQNENLKDVVAENTQLGPYHVLDMTGGLFDQAVELVRKGGQILLFGVNASAVTEISQSKITQKEITVLGTWLANASFPEAISILESNQLPLERLVTHRCSLEELEEMVLLLRQGKTVKVLVDPTK